VPGHTIVFPSGHVVGFAEAPHPRLQLPPTQFTLHDFAPVQSTEHSPVHSMLQTLAFVHPTLDIAPTTALHTPTTESQPTLQLDPQLTAHEAALSQPTLQFAAQLTPHAPPCSQLLLQWLPQESAHDWVFLSQPMLHESTEPQSTVQALVGSHVQLDPEQLPLIVAVVDAGGGTPACAPCAPCPPVLPASLPTVVVPADEHPVMTPTIPIIHIDRHTLADNCCFKA
jgi:hypothetical protein